MRYFSDMETDKVDKKVGYLAIKKSASMYVQASFKDVTMFYIQILEMIPFCRMFRVLRSVMFG